MNRKEIPFEKYNFRRVAYRRSELSYQMGNNEMGGLAHNSGLGFEMMYFADVWRTHIARLGMEGPLLTCDRFTDEDLEKSLFKNELTLKEGILYTKVAFGENAGYRSQIFFSKKNRHLLAIKLTSFFNEDTEWVIKLPTEKFERTFSGKYIFGQLNEKQYYSEVVFALGASEEILKLTKP